MQSDDRRPTSGAVFETYRGRIGVAAFRISDNPAGADDTVFDPDFEFKRQSGPFVRFVRFVTMNFVRTNRTKPDHSPSPDGFLLPHRRFGSSPFALAVISFSFRPCMADKAWPGAPFSGSPNARP